MNKDKVVTQVYQTMDYDKFKFIGGNRRLVGRNFAKLVASMSEEQLMIPILVNSKMEIVDGQHRYSSAKQLGLPIYYIVVEGYDIEQVKRANMVGSNWIKADFLEMHLQSGNPVYREFMDIIEAYGVNISDLIKIFAYVQQVSMNIVAKQFEEGIFDLEGKEMVLSYLEALNDFDSFSQYRTKQFTGAFMKLYFHPIYDHEKMKERLKHRITQLVKKSTISEYLSLLTKDIYSYGAVKKPLYYDTETERFYS